MIPPNIPPEHPEAIPEVFPEAVLFKKFDPTSRNFALIPVPGHPLGDELYRAHLYEKTVYEMYKIEDF